MSDTVMQPVKAMAEKIKYDHTLLFCNNHGNPTEDNTGSFLNPNDSKDFENMSFTKGVNNAADKKPSSIYEGGNVTSNGNDNP